MPPRQLQCTNPNSYFYSKPSSARGKKHIINREPKIIENHKQTLFLQGHKTSPIAVQCLKDFYHLKKPDGKMMSRKNDILPFEDVTPIEGFSRKSDASMFCFASHNKKRPNNIVLGKYGGWVILCISSLLDSIKIWCFRERKRNNYPSQ